MPIIAHRSSLQEDGIHVHHFFALCETRPAAGLARLTALAVLGGLSSACGTFPPAPEGATGRTEIGMQLKASGQLSRLPAAVTAVSKRCEVADDPRSIYFAADSSQLTVADHVLLRRIAAQHRDHPQAHISLVGQADENGSAELVIALAYRRVAAVADFLESLGVPPRRLRRLAQPAQPPAAATGCARPGGRVDLRFAD